MEKIKNLIENPFEYKIYISIVILFYLGLLNAQISIVDPPSPGFEERIKSAVNKILIIDTHEHLTTEKNRINQAPNLDFTLLFQHYAKEDLISSSNESGLVNLIYNDEINIADRWELLKPMYKATRSTGYGRVPLIAARDLYGVPEIDETTIEELSIKIREASKPGLYEYILKNKSKIDLSIQDQGHLKFNPNYYRHVERFDRYIHISSKSEVMNLGKSQKMVITSLDDYLKVLRKSFIAGVDYGMVGVKSGLAYKRILNYKNVSEETATKLFDQLLTSTNLNPNQIKSIQDYIMHRVLDLVGEFDLPIQIHTGLHAGNGNIITNSKPIHLTNLFFEYPNIKFILFHGGYPYGGELATLAKNFPNVYIDMCWTYVISPSYSERYLHEWIETVPANKIMAFGGDYSFVEAVYSHSVMARQIITKVLVSKVQDQYLTEKEAISIAKMILRENALQIFKIGDYKNTFEDVDVLKKPGPLKEWWDLNQSKSGLIRNWKVIGIFDFGSGLDQIYPPEKELNFNKNYSGKGGLVSWATENTSTTGYLNLISVFNKNNMGNNPKDKGIAYAYTEIISPNNRKVKITIGSNDGAKIWLNDSIIYNKHAGRNAVLDQEVLQIKLKKGLNKILVKIENLGAGWGLYLRIIDPDKELKIIEFPE